MFPRSPVPVLIFPVTTPSTPSSAPVFCQVRQDHLSSVGILLGSAGREGKIGWGYIQQLPATVPPFWTSEQVPRQSRR